MARAQKKAHPVLKISLPILTGALFLLAWEMGLLHQIFRLKPYQLPIPSEIVKTLIRLWQKALVDGGVTLSAALLGMLLGSLIGFAVAVFATVFPRWGPGGLTVVSAFNAIPIVALSPIMNNWFERPLDAKVGVITIVTMAAMSVNAYRGMTDLRPFSLDLMKSYAATKKTTFFHLRIPNCIPNVFVALKINVAAAMIGAIVSEYFAQASSGLGFGIKNYLRRADMASGWAYITVAALAGILMYVVILVVERRVIRWHASQR